MRNTEKTFSNIIALFLTIPPLFLLGGCGGGGFLLLGSSGKQSLNELRVLDREDKTEVFLRGEEAVEYMVVSLQDPPRVIVSLLDVWQGDIKRNNSVGKGNIREINFLNGKYPQGALKMEILLHQAARPKIREENNALVFEFSRPEEKDNQKVVEEYRIGPEDVLEVMVWKNNDLTRTVGVRPDGKISLPLLGDIMASGLSTKELKEIVTERFKEYLNNPEVSVLVKEINSYYFYILGEVVNPGKFPLRERTTILQAISMAGGFTPFASKNGLSLFRKNNVSSGEKQLKVKYDDIISETTPQNNLVIQSGDTIVVP